MSAAAKRYDMVVNICNDIITKNDGYIELNQEYCNANRIVYEKLIFDFLKSNYMDFLREFWASYTLPNCRDTKNAVFIYETREHENLEYVIYSTLFYSPNWTLVIYCSEANYEIVCGILGHNKEHADIRLIETARDYVQDKVGYNIFMKTAQLWVSLPYKYVLTIEMDAYLLRHIPEELDSDYYCSEWPWNNEFAGGGGLTIRNVSMMQRICTELPHLEGEIEPQDCWAVVGLKELCGSANNILFTESVPHENPVGVHQWWTFIWPHADIIQLYSNYLMLKVKI
jgi:hypothetical protein